MYDRLLCEIDGENTTRHLYIVCMFIEFACTNCDVNIMKVAFTKSMERGNVDGLILLGRIPSKPIFMKPFVFAFIEEKKGHG